MLTVGKYFLKILIERDEIIMSIPANDEKWTNNDEFQTK